MVFREDNFDRFSFYCDPEGEREVKEELRK